jgi:hypothetical protein
VDCAVADGAAVTTPAKPSASAVTSTPPVRGTVLPPHPEVGNRHMFNLHLPSAGTVRASVTTLSSRRVGPPVTIRCTTSAVKKQ